MDDAGYGGSASALPSLSAPPLHISFHPSLEFAHSLSLGAGLRSTSSIPAKAPLVRVPFSATISILSIPHVDPPWPPSFFEEYGRRPEILTRFLLCELRARGPDSEWWPYISLLPQDFDTPLYWNNDDREWLKGTNLLAATRSREALWLAEWERSMRILSDSLPEALSRYRWESYKWAATVLSSRSFSQDVVRGYMQACEDDTSFSRSELARRWCNGDKTLQFPVLLPGLDLGNHDPNSRVNWLVEDEAVVFTREDGVAAGVDVCNNYGAKGTEELLLGYGFMLVDNDADFVVLSTVSADTNNQPSSKDRDYGPLTLSGRLYAPFSNDDPDRPDRILQRSLLPNDILKLASQVAVERELAQVRPAMPEMTVVPHVNTRRLNVMVDALILSLEDRRSRLEETAPDAEPSTHRQHMAAAYRDAQIDIITLNIDTLTDYLFSLQSKGRILLLSSLLADTSHPAITSPLLSLLSQLCGGAKPKVKTVRARALHELAFTVFICSAWLQWSSGLLADDDKLSPWMRFLERAYGAPKPEEVSTAHASDREDAAVVGSYLGCIEDFGKEDPDSIYADERWNAQLIRFGLRVWRQESIVLKSLGRIVENGGEQEHEDMLFLER